MSKIQIFENIFNKFSKFSKIQNLDFGGQKST